LSGSFPLELTQTTSLGEIPVTWLWIAVIFSYSIFCLPHTIAGLFLSRNIIEGSLPSTIGTWKHLSK
jgi:hypothetical protein